MGRGSRLMGGDCRHRPLGVDRRSPAADPVAGNPQAPTLRPHPRCKRRDARHPRRHGRRRSSIARIAGLRAEGVRRHRGPPLLLPPWHRSVGHLARRHARRAASRRNARRLDHHPAAGQEFVPDPGTHGDAQAAGGGAGALARAQILQGADPRALSQPRLFRLRRLRHRGGGAALFRQIGAEIDAAGSGDAGRPGAIAVAAGAEPQSRRRRAPRRHGDRGDGGSENDRRRRCQARADQRRRGR